MADDDALQAAAATLAAVVGTMLARKLLADAWEQRTGSRPAGLRSEDATLKEAIAWAAVSGAVVGIVRVVSTRGVSRAFGGGPQAKG